MEFNTRNRVDAHIYTHTGHNSKELVFGIGYAEGDVKMGRIGLEVKNHIYI
jgi:hypothetical protein